MELRQRGFAPLHAPNKASSFLVIGEDEACPGLDPGVRVQISQLVSHPDRQMWPFGTFEVEPALIRLTGVVGVRQRLTVMFDGWTTTDGLLTKTVEVGTLAAKGTA
jgi:hypothetical protein